MDILQAFEQSFNVLYYEEGLFDSTEIPMLATLSHSPMLGKVPNGDWNHNERYIVLPKNIAVQWTAYPQRKGGVKYAVNQSMNLKCILIQPSGEFTDGVLVSGTIGTISEDEDSNLMFKHLSSHFRKNFKKVGSFFVGNEAMEKLLNGWRLVQNIKSPLEYDLKIEVEK